MEKWKTNKFFKGNAASFQPNRDYINRAVDEYLKSGGEIQPLNLDNRNYDVNSKIGLFYEADDFLFGK